MEESQLDQAFIQSLQIPFKEVLPYGGFAALANEQGKTSLWIRKNLNGQTKPNPEIIKAGLQYVQELEQKCQQFRDQFSGVLP